MAVITGTAGNDTLIGTSDADTIYGLDGDDLIIGGFGADTLSGGSGSDTFKFSVSDSQASLEDLIVDFQTGVDKIDVSSLNSPLIFLTVKNGGTEVALDESLSLPTFFNLIFYSSNPITTTDFIISHPAIFWLVGDSSPNMLVGGPGNDLISGGSGDTLTGGAGADTFLFGSPIGNNPIVITDFQTGVDHIDFPASPHVMPPAPMAKIQYTLDGAIIDDNIIVHGYVDPADIYTHSNFDPYTVDSKIGSVYLLGTSGSDTLKGLIGPDKIAGGGGADILTGNAGLFGQDTFIYFSASDSTASSTDLITDFVGSDIIDLTAVNASSVSVIRSGGASFLFANTPDGSMVINVSGAVNANNIVWGTGHAGVYLVGDDAGDILVGGSLGDSIHGGSGNDLITGGVGADGLYGGAGADTFKFAIGDSTANATDLIFDFQSGTDKVDVTGFSLTHISTIDDGTAEFLFVGAGTQSTSFLQFAAVGVDVIQADDFLVSGLANFYMQGDSGANTLKGGAGNDVIDGHDGNDLIIGGGSSDALFGGAGSDTFKYLTASDSSVSAADTIFDFETGIDKIDLSSVHAAGVGSYGIAYTSTGSYLFVDVNGDGVNDMLIQFTTTALTPSDILWTKPSDTVASPASAAASVPTAEVSFAQVSSNFTSDQGEHAHAWNASIFQPHTLEPTDLLHL
jgi:Ca2+-binding RTX toxin-like protein